MLPNLAPRFKTVVFRGFLAHISAGVACSKFCFAIDPAVDGVTEVFASTTYSYPQGHAVHVTPNLQLVRAVTRPPPPKKSPHLHMACSPPSKGSVPTP